MKTIEKRDYIHNYLYSLSDEDINEVFNKVKSVVENDVVLTNEQSEEIERRISRHKKGESKSFSWSDVKKKAKSQL